MKKTKAIVSVSLVTAIAALSTATTFAAEAATDENPIVSAVNFSPVYGDKEANISAMADIIKDAASSGTDIIIFPEYSLTGNLSGSTDAVSFAESKSGQTAAYFSDLSEEYDMYIVYGTAETVDGDDEHAYDSAFVCTPDGKVDSYQKMLVSDEGDWCVSGTVPVYFETEFGRVGLSVGSDVSSLIELSRIYSAEDCFMIADVSSIEAKDYTEEYDFSAAVYDEFTDSYYNKDWTDYNRNSIYNVVYQAGLYVASANLIGEYNGKSYQGGSIIAGMNDSEEYNKIWSLWSTLIDQKADLVDYIIKVYAGGDDSTETLCTAELDLNTVTHELVAMDIYQPNLYSDWYSELVDKGTSLTAEPTASENPVVATVNMTPVWADKTANTDKMLDYIESASQQGVNIIVFPEMALGDYASTSDPDSEIWKTIVENSEATDGYYANIIAEAAKTYNMYIIYGTAEINPDDEQHPYNSAFVATPDGETLSYRKVHVVEGDWATWGEEPLIVDTPWGSMGISICMDTYAFPELARYYAAAGCKILINPTASTGYAGSNFIYNNAISSIVSRDSMALISSDLVNVSGYEDSMLYPGKSTIITTNGVSAIYLNSQSMTEETMYVSTLDLSNAGFSYTDYNASILAQAYEKMTAGEAVYDYSGLVAAADYASADIEATTEAATVTEATAEAVEQTDAVSSTSDSSEVISSAATVDSVSDDGSTIKTGDSEFVLLILFAVISGFVAVYAVRKREQSTK